MRGIYFFPFTLVFVIGLFFLLVFLFICIQVGLIGYAYERIGMSAHWILPLLLLSLLGSAINIPLTQVRSGPVVSQQVVHFFGMRYVIPIVEQRQPTVIAINVGGAIVPTLISVFLLVSSGLFVQGVLGTTLVTAIVHHLARPIAGVGIAVPMFGPPLIAAVIGLALAPEQAPALAYMTGTLGCLIGADLLNVHRIADLGAPVASIGGAGTFDGIFFTGILAALLT